LERIAANREANLFIEIGKLTRGLHNAILTIRLDARLIGLPSLTFGVHATGSALTMAGEEKGFNS